MSEIDKMENLVKGSKGIMDLDLELVPKAFHKEALKQHYKDIEEYDMYQLTLPEKLRYENTILRINQQHKRDRKIESKRMQLDYEEKTNIIHMKNNSLHSLGCSKHGKQGSDE